MFVHWIEHRRRNTSTRLFNSHAAKLHLIQLAADLLRIVYWYVKLHKIFSSKGTIGIVSTPKCNTVPNDIRRETDRETNDWPFPGLYYTRHHYLHHIYRIIPSFVYDRLPNSFADDIEAGLSSDAFSLAGNVEDNDSRAGLDVESKREILRIMKRKGVSFDDARMQFMQNKLAKNGIGPDGRPLDPRAVFFS